MLPPLIPLDCGCATVHTHPQVMQQHCELSCGGDHGSFLPALSAALRQFQAPAPQITVRTKRPQNVLRSLHQQGSQIRVALLADMHLRLAPPRVSSPWYQAPRCASDSSPQSVR
jgi:hypothetical protein